MNILTDLQIALPDALLAGFALVGVLLGAAGGDRTSGFLRLLSVIALAAAAVLTFLQFPAGVLVPKWPMLLCSFSNIMKIVK